MGLKKQSGYLHRSVFIFYLLNWDKQEKNGQNSNVIIRNIRVIYRSFTFLIILKGRFSDYKTR